jgi:predicted 3-demethylubiquinone-9 3-methyltransferase (glyoxalase superfamily)
VQRRAEILLRGGTRRQCKVVEPSTLVAKEEAMPLTAQKITPCLWFDTQAEEAANFYCSVFKNSKIENISRYGKEGHEIHGREAGSVMTVAFELDGQKFVGLNGGPLFKFDEAISFQIYCDTQKEVDYYWAKLTEGGQEGPCGWLKDKFGLSWQVVPKVLLEMLMDSDTAKSQRVTKAFLQMKKFDIEALKRAYHGQSL